MRSTSSSVRGLNVAQPLDVTFLTRDALSVEANHVVAALVDRTSHLTVGQHGGAELTDASRQMVQLGARRAPVELLLKPAERLAKRADDLCL